MTRNKHNYTIDVLRIIFMSLIIFHHFSLYAASDFVTNSPTLNATLFIGKNIANVCNIFFIVVFGYFCSIRFKKDKFIKTLVLMLGYHFVIEILFAVINHSLNLDLVNFLLTNNYWFIKFYLLYLIIGPFFKRFLDKLNQKQALFTVIVAYVLATIPIFLLQPILEEEIFLIVKSYLIDNTIKYFPYFLFGIYLRKFPIKIKYPLLLTTLGIIPFALATRNFLNGIVDDYNIWLSLEKLFILGASFISIGIVIWALQKENTKKVPIVEVIVPSILAVYIIHEQPKVRSFLWKALFPATKLSDSFWILQVLLIVFLVFVSCILIDLIRKKLVN